MKRILIIAGALVGLILIVGLIDGTWKGTVRFR